MEVLRPDRQQTSKSYGWCAKQIIVINHLLGIICIQKDIQFIALSG